MSHKRYVEGKYSCNHPESDFANNSDGPIEMKRENFTEYTHRNETANMQYDVWGNSNNTVREYKNDGEYSSNPQYNKGYSSNNIKKSSNGLSVFIIILLIYGLPMLLGVLFQILEDLL